MQFYTFDRTQSLSDQVEVGSVTVVGVKLSEQMANTDSHCLIDLPFCCQNKSVTAYLQMKTKETFHLAAFTGLLSV